MTVLDLSMPSRRQFIRAGAIGAGLALANRFGAVAASDDRMTAARPKSAIFVFLSGGPAHLDTYDLKPEAPESVRGAFRPIATNVAGIDICEHFPLQAAMFDKFVLLRGVVAREVVHTDVEVMTGCPSTTTASQTRPSIGAVVSNRRGMLGGVPAFVSLRGMSAGCEPGIFGAAHRPFTPAGADAAALRRPSGVSASRFASRAALLDALDVSRREVARKAGAEGMSSFQARAMEMITSGAVRAALDLDREPAQTRERYEGAEAFLLARRLIEAGVGYVTLGVEDWDTHFPDHFPRLRDHLLPTLDRGLSSLVSELHERGLSDDCLVIVMGEFGRTPRINSRGGRDHWLPAMSVLLACGGLATGRVIGSTGKLGEEPRSRRSTVSQVLAAVYRIIGIDPGLIINDAAGRPVALVDGREPISGLN